VNPEAGNLLGSSVQAHKIVLAAHQLPVPHRHPADRFLAATAQVMDLPLVTGDDNFLSLGTIRTMKN
jgi:PIN domain nuclease of toxin-antitoxin system